MTSGHYRRLLSGLLLLSLACAPSPPYRVEMTFQATNTADHILVVEGETNLPAGSPLNAELRSREGLVMLRDVAVVSQSKFYFDFDLSELDGLSLYQVHVRFDPQAAPLGVRRVTGLWGEALEGTGVKEVDSRRVVERKLEVILTAGGKAQDWEGRDFSSMGVSERGRIITQLEKLTEEQPSDRSAKFALARAYIAADARERDSGTRAYALLKEVTAHKQDDRVGVQAGKILASIEAADAKALEAAEQSKKISRGDRFRKETTIWPGRAMGAFTLGTSYRILQRHLKLDVPPDFSNPDFPGVARPTDFPGLELRFDSTTRRLVSARTTSKRFKLPEGFKVGSSLQELQKAYGKEAVPAPTFRYKGTRADGKKIYRGKVLTDGLEFEIVREVDPVLPLPLDLVEAISVFEGS